MILLRVALVLLITAALVPELWRYAAERRLYEASAVLQAVFVRPQPEPYRRSAITWATSTALGAAAGLPRDWRPLNLAGSAFLLGGQPDQALATYRQALQLGERPEIDINVGRAHAALGRSDRATAAFLRAGWVSPAVLSALPLATRTELRSELAALERKLVEGHLSAPPAPPP